MAKKLKVWNGASWEDVTFAITPPTTNVTNEFTTNQIIDVNTSVPALRITQGGSGDALRIESGGIERMRINAAGTVQFANQIISNVAQGTAPFSVASTTLVTNLNVGYLQGTPLSYIVYGNGLSGANQASGTQNLLEMPQYKAGFWDIAPGSSWAPTNSWYWGVTLAHTSNSSGYNYAAQIAVQNGNRHGIYVRTISGGPAPAASTWSRILTETSAAVTGSQTINDFILRNIYASTSTPSGGNDGDMWAVYV